LWESNRVLVKTNETSGDDFRLMGREWRLVGCFASFAPDLNQATIRRREANIMAEQPRLIDTLEALREAIGQYRRAGKRVALVPTMGALHDGHFALVRLAAREARQVVVSIFVNPTQFGPTEDFAAYPRDMPADVAALARLKADLVWAPPVALMYPPGFATQVIPAGPATVGLEDAFRPHFFAGVATVVTKLLLQCLPDTAIFGEKDYQQLKVVEQIVRDLDIPVRIVSGSTVRAADGLALSSRNAYLSAEQRQVAPTLHRVLALCGEKLAAGRPVGTVLSEGRETIERVGFELDYLEARHAETLLPLADPTRETIRLLVAARLGATRLIDNVGV
jgi:pantoate--beta-alanine ligase